MASIAEASTMPGTAVENGEAVTSGGRVLSVAAMSGDLRADQRMAWPE